MHQPFFRNFQEHSIRENALLQFSTSFAIKGTRWGTCSSDSGLGWRKSDCAIAENKARNADAAISASFIKYRAIISQTHELLKVSYMFAYVDNLVIRIALYFGFYTNAVGTCRHGINGNHNI